MEKFIQEMKDQFIDGDELTFNAETRFRDVESFDSLTGMAMIMIIQDNYNKLIDEKLFKELNTLGELYKYIQG